MNYLEACEIVLNEETIVKQLRVQDTTSTTRSESLARVWSCLRSTILHERNNGWRDSISQKPLRIADRGRVMVVFEFHSEELHVHISKF